MYAFWKFLFEHGGLTLLTIIISTMSSVEGDACPRRCTCSSPSQMSCKSSGLRDLPSGLGDEVTTLDFGQNAVSQLSARVLASIQQLTTLKLESNRITRIKDDSFQNMGTLVTLNLSGNQLRHITVASFRGLSKLEFLDLSSNRLESIEEGFTHLPALKRLDLTSNRISAVTQFTFRELSSIRFLILSDNSITYIDRRAFQALSNIMYLVLKANPVSNIDNIVYNSALLSYVDFSECSLRYVPKGLPTSLRYLQLRRNNMTLIHREAFVSTPYLNILVLDENGIAFVERNAFNRLLYLQQLWMNANELTYIPGELPASLQRLLMDNNRLVQLTNNFPENAKLDTLSLMGNNITFIAPDALNHLSLITNIDLSDNHIRSLYPGTFANLTNLNTLQLSKNPLKYFYDRSLEGLFHLRTLELAYIGTNATMHPRAFDDLTGIKYLNLDSSPGIARSILKSPTLLNNLYTVEELKMQAMDFPSLPTEFADVFYNLDMLSLTSTRWHCDEGMRWFRDWLLSATLMIETRDNLRCFTPHALHNRPIANLQNEELAPVITTLRPLLRPVTAIYFPPVPTIIYPESPPPSTITTPLTPKSPRRGWRRKKLTTTPIASTTRLSTTKTVILPVDLQFPDFGHYYDEEIRDHIVGEDHLPPPRTTIPVVISPNYGHIEIRTVSNDDALQAGRTTTPPFGQNYSRISSTMLVIVAGGVISTIVVLAVAITIIVLGSKKCRQKASPLSRNGENGDINGIPADKKTIQYHHKDSTLYFMTADSDPIQTTLPPLTPIHNTGSIRSIKSTKSGKNAKLNGSNKERMSLVSGRDVNHEGPLKIYKWDEF